MTDLAANLSVSLRDLVLAANKARMAVKVAMDAARVAPDGVEQLARANEVLRVVGSLDTEAGPGADLERLARTGVEEVRYRLAEADEMLTTAVKSACEIVTVLHARGLTDPARPVLRVGDFGTGLWAIDPRGFNYPARSVTDSGAMLLGRIDALRDDHPARTLCGPDELVQFDGRLWLALGVPSQRPLPWLDLAGVRSLTISWRRLSDELARRQAEEREAEKRALQAERERRKAELRRLEAEVAV